MSKLKELTQENHRRAERARFMHRMVKKQITDYQYYVYLVNQFMSYYVLESYADQKGLFDGMQDLKRSLKISKDLSEFEILKGFTQPAILKTTMDYMTYLESISRDSDKLMSHIYVRHMGDLSGGQILKKLVPGTAHYYEFDCDVAELKTNIRSKLNDDMVEESKKCFDMVYYFLEELENSFAVMGTTD